MSDEDSGLRLVGAREKLHRARLVESGVPIDTFYAARPRGPGRAVLGILVASVGLAWLLTLGPVAHGGMGLRIPNDWLNALLLGAAPPHLSENPQVNDALVILVRGLAVFLLTGFLPLCARTWTQVAGGGSNPFLAFWRLSIILPGLFLFLQYAVPPLAARLGALLK
jgi:hypothetical protein